jgi:uncharacterized OB-fold protein
MSEFLMQLAAYVPAPGVRKLNRRRTYANCKSCGSFKSRPSSECPRCGDDPVTHNGNRRAYDRGEDWPY